MHIQNSIDSTTITLHVTQAHIDKAQRLHTHYNTRLRAIHFCPIAFALKATGRFKVVSVNANQITLDDRIYDTSDDTRNFVNDFDDCQDVDPITLVFTYYH